MSTTMEMLATLRKLDSPTIANVIELFDVRPRSSGYMDGRIRANFPEMPPMVGFASTATFRSVAPAEGGDVYGKMASQLEHFRQLPGPAVVVFQDLDDPPVGATFGEVMCSTYRGFGAVGLVTSGAGRDLEQVRGLGFPVFTASTIVSHAYCHIVDVGVPLHVGGLVVRPGDLLHGDANGVVSIPTSIAAAVAELAEPFVQAENLVMEYVKSEAEKTPEGLRARQQEYGKAVAALRNRALSGHGGK